MQGLGLTFLEESITADEPAGKDDFPGSPLYFES
jgi:hypothetical protein